MIRNKYERIIDQFEKYYPNLYERTVDWWASGRTTITVRLDDDTTFEYDPMDDSIRQVFMDWTDADDMTVRKAFGNNLQKLLPYSGMNKSDLADKVGVSRVMMSQYINGKSVPNIIIARKIAKALKCRIDDLFDDRYTR